MKELSLKGKLGVDIGGTFTDAVLEFNGQRFTDKVLTTQDAPEKGVMQAVDTLLDHANASPNDVSLIIHGTTLATNALIERKGAKTAFVTTQGFRDVLEIRLEHRFEQYDIFLDLPTPLVPRHRRFVVNERITAHGDIIVAMDENSMERLAIRLARQKYEAVAIGFLHSYINDTHEQRAAEIIRRHLPNAAITLSSETAPEMKEYERFSTACANAYIQPKMASYLAQLETRLQTRGLDCPLLMMLSGGGLTTIETSRRFPVRLVESGPAGGAIFSAHIAAQRGLDKVLSFDMGGTTAKICLIDDGKPQTARSFEVGRTYRFKKGSGFPLRIPVIEMVEIGAGGGSIARVNSLKQVTVGPDSAGSEPGPACYGRGGDQPAVTDANVILGRIDPDSFSGGRMKLDKAAAQRALEIQIGQHLDMRVVDAAHGISEMVDENMASAARVHAIESGKEMQSRTLIAFGGGAPLHATRIADKLGIKRILIPPSAGVGSAVGFLRAPIAYEIVRSHYQVISSMDIKTVNTVLDAMANEAKRVVGAATTKKDLVQKRVAFLRYFGQGHEISVAVPTRKLKEPDRQMFRDLFEAEYRRLYGRIVPDAEVELLTWKVSIESPVPDPETLPLPGRIVEPLPSGKRKLLDVASRKYITVPVFSRTTLEFGARIPGPAIISEDETSTVIGGDFEATIDQYGCIDCTRLRPANPTTSRRGE